MLFEVWKLDLYMATIILFDIYANIQELSSLSSTVQQK